MRPESRMRRAGFHGIAHGTVFIVKLQFCDVNNGINGRIWVSHLPMRLQMKENVKQNYEIHYKFRVNIVTIQIPKI